MAQGDRRVKNIYYGYGESDFYFRLDSKEVAGDEVIVDFHLPAPVRLRIIRQGEEWRVNLEKSKDGVVYEQTDCVTKVAEGKGLQVQLPFSSLGWRREGGEVSFLVRVVRGGAEVERYPERGLIEFSGPVRALDMKNWYI